jgi:hypothetical protein
LISLKEWDKLESQKCSPLSLSPEIKSRIEEARFISDNVTYSRVGAISAKFELENRHIKGICPDSLISLKEWDKLESQKCSPLSLSPEIKSRIEEARFISDIEKARLISDNVAHPPSSAISVEFELKNCHIRRICPDYILNLKERHELDRQKSGLSAELINYQLDLTKQSIDLRRQVALSGTRYTNAELQVSTIDIGKGKETGSISKLQIHQKDGWQHICFRRFPKIFLQL